MSRTLYVGNLPLSANAETLTAKFASCGTVISVKVPADDSTGRVKGVAFVEMENQAQAQAVIDRFNMSNYDGRLMSVNKLRATAP